MSAEERTGLTVIRSPHPTPNGPLHLGHQSGPYIAADVAARAARNRGYRVLALCGTDDHQNSIMMKARSSGLTPDEVISSNTAVIQETLARTGITHDVFVRPYADPEHQALTRKLFDEMVATGLVITAERVLLVCHGCGKTMHNSYVTGGCPFCAAEKTGGTCEVCGTFSTADTMTSCRCAVCGGIPVEARAPGPVLPLEAHRARLTRLWAGAVLPPSVRALLTAHLDRPLPSVAASHPTDWGIEVTGGERLDAWFEMGLTYLVTVGRHVDPRATTLKEFARAWSGVDSAWSFLGLDTGFYYAALFPALFAAAGVPDALCVNGLAVNELYLYEGDKFSTSRGHAVWASDLLQEASPEIVRLFMCWNRPDTHSTNFTRDTFEYFRAKITPLIDKAHATSIGFPTAPVPPETLRAHHALTLESFDPAMAIRCLMTALTDHNDPEATRLLRLIM
jgi:methionyl-tRNA synthetase